jgi:hypothetical protein
MSDMTRIAERGLTSLDEENTKQAPVPEFGKDLILRRRHVTVGVSHKEKEFITRTSGAVLEDQSEIQNTKEGISNTTVLTSGLCVGG